MTQNFPRPKAGERWRVTREGTVEHGDGLCTRVVMDDGYSFTSYADKGTWERLPDPEPEWSPGDLVIDACGRDFLRTAPHRPGHPEFSATLMWRDRSGDMCTDSYLSRPLRRLVPEVKS